LKKLKTQFSWTIGGVTGLNLAFLASAIYYSIARQPDLEKVITGYFVGFVIATGAGLVGGLLADLTEMLLDKQICRTHHWEYNDYLFSKDAKEKSRLRKEQLQRIFGK
jgi:F0F1-type ATP synthase membrane subunit c/vacuolar-type H+-ATPase subunit K